VRTLHLACLPFPSPQGTQAIVRAMVEALADAGHETHLLTYAHGAGDVVRGVEHHRLSDFPRTRSLRSGPSLSKVALDLRMIASARRLASSVRPDLVLAHGVEAAYVARLAWLPSIARTIYYAHTRFDAELPTYVRSTSATHVPRALRTLGDVLDTGASRLRTVTITPDLAAHLARRSHTSTLLPPWSPIDPPRTEERVSSRASLELPADGKVVLYAGNLDGYQGWEEAAEAARRASATLLVATESDPRPLAPFPHRHVRLSDEHDRRRAYAACDLAIVPRRAPGGLPIKLLDALARDVPVVAGPRALAGLDPRGVERADTDEAPALAAAITRALACAPRGGRAWIEDSLAPARFVASVEALARGA
jgi:glycosyltransferase involved in cell wall biosynthesis